MKTVSLMPINRKPQIHTQQSILDALLVEQVDVLMACGGRGRCATCHVFVDEGMDKLSAMDQRELRTINRLSGCGPTSRLACQARVLGEGVRVRLPKGMYISRDTKVEDLIGKRAQQNIIHPITGEILVEEGKLVTRHFIMKLKDVQMDLDKLSLDED